MLGQHQPRASRQLDRGKPRCALRALVTSCDRAARRLDAYAVGRSSVGDPPAALIEPYLAMPAARIEPIDHDVAVLSLAHAIATALRDGSELGAADAARVLDLD